MLPRDYIERAAPPGSTRYFALLYSEPDSRSALEALFVIESEIKSTLDAAHEVAHSRLQWWRAEIDRLVNRNAQHPATQQLQSALPNADFSVLHELLTAVDMDLVRMTYNNDRELRNYLARSGGTIFRLLARDTSNDGQRIGAFIRRAETIRDLLADARMGRIYWPLDELQSQNIEIEQLRNKEPSAAIRGLICNAIDMARKEFSQIHCDLRSLRVLGALHDRLLLQILKADGDIFTQRHELGPLRKVWTAWLAARSV